MQKLKLLKVRFGDEIRFHEIPAFRGGVAAKASHSLLFHNHIDDHTLRYAYPLIQYKRIRNHPSIICVGEGVDEIHRFFENSDWSFEISGRTLDMKIEELDMKQFTMQVWDKQFTYRVNNWLALSQKNYTEYRKLEGMVEQAAFLEKKLIGNILSMAKGIGWDIDKQIECKILDFKPVHLRFKGQKLMAFNATFKTNVFLPNYLGLGGKTGFGFGTVTEVKK
ncbi:CRISPR-associated endonuclease Cas6 [Algivirga pacifica]|uniref:DNA repair protein n=1 Tax=Algivirga pacifica TaxID=1162670 RepID=A0ABP9D4Q9_9BACT